MLKWLKENTTEKGSYLKEEDTKFGQYQLEGDKEGYKEILVTLPNRIPTYGEYQKMLGYPGNSPMLEKQYLNQYGLKQITDRSNNEFKSNHFDEKNILVHLRMNTRTDAEGNKVLFLEEVQSDWGQKGKKEGFDNKLEQRKELEKRGVTFNNNGTVSLKSQDEFYEQGETWELIKKYNDTYTNKAITPTAPFVTDTNAWTKLALKVALKESIKQSEVLQRNAWGKMMNEKEEWIEARMKKLGKLRIECP